MVRRPSHPRALRVELLHLPGLGAAVTAEAAEQLPLAGPPRPLHGRADSVTVDLLVEGDEVEALATVIRLRTIVAGFTVLEFTVPRPRSLCEPSRLQRIASAMRTAARLADAATQPMRSFRIDAAGAQSPTFQRLATELAAATGLVHDLTDGACVLRFRRDPTGKAWQVLVRLSPRPLSARPWRQARFRGALNATVAATAVALSRPRPHDRVANLMCGSGTLLIERLLAGPAAMAVGVDNDPRALRACARNLAEAGLTEQACLVCADIRADHWAGSGRYDALFADPPWGDKVGQGADAAAIHADVLRRAAQLGTAHARLVVVTHRIQAMQRCLRDDHAGQWRLIDETRVWAKGHHPRIYLLHRNQAPRVG